MEDRTPISKKNVNYDYYRFTKHAYLPSWLSKFKSLLTYNLGN